MLLSVMVKAARLCSALFQMLFIVMLVFSSVGMALFGGNVTSATPAAYKKITGGDWNSGMDYLNFNDYFTSMYCLYVIFTGGWNGVDETNMFMNPKYNKKIAYEYFFISYFLVANICLMNVVQSFFIDQICAATAYEEELAEEEGQDGGALEIDGEVEIEEDKQEPPMSGGLFGGLGVSAEVELQPVDSTEGEDNTLLNVEVDVGVPDVAIEVDVEVPDVAFEVEVGFEAPVVEIQVDIEVPELEVEVAVEVPEVEVDVEIDVEVDADIQVNPDAVAEPVDAELEVEVDVDVEVDVQVEL